LSIFLSSENSDFFCNNKILRVIWDSVFLMFLLWNGWNLVWNLYLLFLWIIINFRTIYYHLNNEKSAIKTF
jgi:hypothetical protein